MSVCHNGLTYVYIFKCFELALLPAMAFELVTERLFVLLFNDNVN